MSHNPYEAGEATRSESGTRATRWMIVVGVVAILLAAMCLIATVLGMMWSFQTIANSSASPAPSDLASSISMAAIPSYAVVPLAIIGVVFLISGFVRRHSAAKK